MKIKKVHVLSVAKIAMFIYALMGLFMGIIFSIFSLFLGTLLSTISNNPNVSAEISGSFPSLGIGISIGSIIVMPIMYGIIGFVGGLIGGLIYNISAKFVGGIEIETENIEIKSSVSTPSPGSQQASAPTASTQTADAAQTIPPAA